MGWPMRPEWRAVGVEEAEEAVVVAAAAVVVGAAAAAAVVAADLIAVAALTPFEHVVVKIVASFDAAAAVVGIERMADCSLLSYARLVELVVTFPAADFLRPDLLVGEVEAPLTVDWAAPTKALHHVWLF